MIGSLLPFDWAPTTSGIVDTPPKVAETEVAWPEFVRVLFEQTATAVECPESAETASCEEESHEPKDLSGDASEIPARKTNKAPLEVWGGLPCSWPVVIPAFDQGAMGAEFSLSVTAPEDPVTSMTPVTPEGPDPALGSMAPADFFRGSPFSEPPAPVLRVLPDSGAQAVIVKAEAEGFEALIPLAEPIGETPLSSLSQTPVGIDREMKLVGDAEVPVASRSVSMAAEPTRLVPSFVGEPPEETHARLFDSSKPRKTESLPLSKSRSLQVDPDSVPLEMETRPAAEGDPRETTEIGPVDGRVPSQPKGLLFDAHAMPDVTSAAVEVTGEAQGPVATSRPEFQRSQEIVRQVLEQADVQKLKEGHEILLQLEPKELGKLSLRLAVAGHAMSLEARVESSEARQALETHFPQLEQALGAHRITVETFNVEVTSPLGPAESQWSNSSTPFSSDQRRSARGNRVGRVQPMPWVERVGTSSSALVDLWA